MAAVSVHDAGYAHAIERERPLLQATAYLLSGDPVRAQRLVQLVLAQLYERWPHVQRPQIEALRALIRADRRDAHLPWEAARRFELVDGALLPPATAPIIADLRRLPYDQRAAIILERYAELPTVQIAAVMERPIETVLSASRAAQSALVDRQPARSPDGVVAAELARAVPAELRRPGNSADDLDRGRRLRRRHQLRRALIGLAAIVLAIVTTSQLVPAQRVPAAEAPAAAPAAVSESDPMRSEQLGLPGSDPDRLAVRHGRDRRGAHRSHRPVFLGRRLRLRHPFGHAVDLDPARGRPRVPAVPARRWRDRGLRPDRHQPAVRGAVRGDDRGIRACPNASWTATVSS